MTRIKITLALSLLSTALLATAPAHAQTRVSITSQARYTLPAAIMGCDAHLYGKEAYVDGSISYIYGCTSPNGYGDAYLLYTLNTHNPSYAAAWAASQGYKKSFADPMVDGTVQSSVTGMVWSDQERGGDKDRLTMGTALHRVAIIVTVVSDPSDDVRMPDYVGKVLIALARRVP
jgi:hypothetical protein